MPAATPIAALDPRLMVVLPLGVGNAFARRKFNSSFLVIHGGRALLVDCPAPLRRVLWEAERRSGIALDAGDVDGVLLTHLHGDHCNGIEELGFYFRYVDGRDRVPELALLRGNIDPLWQHRLRAAMGGSNTEPRALGDYFDPVVPLDPGQAASLLGGAFRITTRVTRHSATCGAAVIECAGGVLGYSADAEFDPALVEFLAAGDLVIHEAGEGKGHTFAAELETLPPDVTARMLLIHRPDDGAPESTIPDLREGVLYVVGRGREPQSLDRMLRPSRT